MKIQLKNCTTSFWFWKGLPSFHCMPRTAEGEKTLLDTVAASLTLLESTEEVPSLGLATWGMIILLLKGDTRGYTIPLLPSLSLAASMFLLVILDAEGTESRGPLLETMLPETRGMLFFAWFDRLFMLMFLTSATSEKWWRWSSTRVTINLFLLHSARLIYKGWSINRTTNL